MSGTSNLALPIVIENHSFVCNEDRMWNLNEIHRVLNLPDNKAPSQWRDAISREMTSSANLHSYNGNGSLATEAGTIAYAMWVSTSFYLMVINAFIFMRNDAVIRERVAVLQADEANSALSIAAPKASIFDERLSRGGSVPWTWACKTLGLAPYKLRDGLKCSGKFILPEFTDQKTPFPKKSGFDEGLFVWKLDAQGAKTWQVTARGYAWMQENAARWRELIADADRLRAKHKRRAKSLSKTPS